MDFLNDLMGLILLFACLGIILVFLKDYIRIGGKQMIVNKREKTIIYRIYYKNQCLTQGTITEAQLPIQFGRNTGNGNDVVIVPEGKKIPDEDAHTVSRAWFFIQKDAMGNTLLYSAEPSVGGMKKVSDNKKLVVSDGGKWRAMHTVRLESELRLKADQFQVILNKEEPEESM